MPCWTIRETRVELKAANIDLLVKAFTSCGFAATVDNQTIWLSGPGVTGNWRDGRLTTKGEPVDTNAVLRAYSRESIVTTAKQKGWQLRFKADGVIEATRRRFA